VTQPFDPAQYPSLAGLGERLRELAGDSAFQSGREYFRKGQVSETGVAGSTAHASVTGSTVYRVSVNFAGEVKPACTCPAHRRNKFCKHVVAVCTALLERPGDFAAVEAPPEPEPRTRGIRSGERGARTTTDKRAERAALRASGLETLDRLMEELADGGLMTLGPAKAALLADAGELVRALKLRRLGNLLLALQRAAGDGRSIDPHTFATLLTDLYLTRRAAGAYLDKRADVDPRLAEDLLGKTWRETELEPVAGLELLELAYTRADEGEFRIETSYLVDLPTAAVYLERQISPRRRFTPKSRYRLRLLVKEAGLYPGMPPRRIRFSGARHAPITAADIDRLLTRTPDTVSELRRQLVERLNLPFGVVEIALLFRPAALVTCGNQIGALDRTGAFLALQWPEGWAKELAALLPDSGSYALFGLLDGAGQHLRLSCLSVVGSKLRWSKGPVYPDG
jgi:hypothetical protein